MLFYSFLGLLTLQIGVAVLAALFITLAIVVIIVNSDFHTEGETPINYIILGIFIMLILIAGLMMFLAAYHESKNMCTFSMVLMVIILFLYLIASLISFLNMPSMTKNVCVYRSHCPESCWLSGLNYRKNSTGAEVNETTEEPVTEGGSSTTTEQVTTYETGPDDDFAITETHFQRRRGKWREKEPYSPTTISDKHTSKTNESSKIDLTVQFPIDSTDLNNRLFEDYNDNDGFLRIVKRSVSFIANYFKEEPSPRMHKLIQRKYKRDSESDENKNEGVTEGVKIENKNIENGEDTTEPVPEEEPKQDEDSGYDFGYDFFVAVILFLLITIFFIFTFLLLLSYRKQLIHIRSSKNLLTE